MAALVVDSAAPSAAAIHVQVAEAFALDDRGAGLVRAALVLSADHELNASSFAARVVSSTGASMRAAVIAGLAALTGPRHGGATARVEAFFDAVGSGDPDAALRDRLVAGEDVPGFGHPLYPNGDPRAAAILSWLRGVAPDALTIAEAQERLTGRPPMLDFALVALRRARAAAWRRLRSVRPRPHRRLDRACAGAARAAERDPSARRLRRASARLRLRSGRLDSSARYIFPAAPHTVGAAGRSGAHKAL
jgi:hypothetical protein